MTTPDTPAIQSRLAAQHIGSQLHYARSVDSTMTSARAALAAGPRGHMHGAVFLAEEQTKGGFAVHIIT